ncbi:hypothetical protein LZ318_11830 [Saccharopolyspora indica]|uniref:hypothetical protein n=1 Tax=Saccharopolyspora indica TaxID=1229659 RepID=UPI0022EA7050|nr:hypothetical protein [Saccharopolyspora indica]MDA3643799.1 hypothetical protein [Saccharopolyspora indica]
MNNDVIVLELARKIAAELGDGWQATEGSAPSNNIARLVHSTGATLHLSTHGWRKSDEGKLGITASLQQYGKVTEYREPTHEIKVSYNKKTPAQIAQDIKRRLLPNYQKRLAELAELQAQYDEHEAEQEAFIRDLAATLGDAARRSSFSREWIDFRDLGQIANGHARVLSATVEFQVEVPKEFALLLAAELAALGKRKKG